MCIISRPKYSSLYINFDFKLRFTSHSTQNRSFYRRSSRRISCLVLKILNLTQHHHHHNRFMALFSGPPRWASARTELLNFMVQGKINRGIHTDNLARCHSIRTKQCPPLPSPHNKSKHSSTIQKYYNTKQTQNTKARFDCLVRPPAWKWSRPYSTAPRTHNGLYVK